MKSWRKIASLILVFAKGKVNFFSIDESDQALGKLMLMVLILDGCLEYDAHLWSEFGNLICIRHFFHVDSCVKFEIYFHRNICFPWQVHTVFWPAILYKNRAFFLCGFHVSPCLGGNLQYEYTRHWKGRIHQGHGSGSGCFRPIRINGTILKAILLLKY